MMNVSYYMSCIRMGSKRIAEVKTQEERWEPFSE